METRTPPRFASTAGAFLSAAFFAGTKSRETLTTACLDTAAARDFGTGVFFAKGLLLMFQVYDRGSQLSALPRCLLMSTMHRH